MWPQMMSGTVFNIQTYCIHDGPGIRSTVFLKGCPLLCKWCQNPESQFKVPQLMFYPDRCKMCGACVTACSERAIAWEPGTKPRTDRTKCAACGLCVAVCPAGSREIAGTVRTAQSVVDELKRDKLFFDGSGGGITVSGGEPLFQPDFTEAILKLSHDEGMHTAVESSCFAPIKVIDQVFRHVDLALCDVKHMDSAEHKRLTGVPNTSILENICHIHNDLGVKVAVRTPVVPNCNGDDANIIATARFVKERLGQNTPLHLLPYHRLGESKAQSLERSHYELNIEPPSAEEMNRLKALSEAQGLLDVRIGG